MKYKLHSLDKLIGVNILTKKDLFANMLTLFLIGRICWASCALCADGRMGGGGVSSPNERKAH